MMATPAFFPTSDKFSITRRAISGSAGQMFYLTAKFARFDIFLHIFLFFTTLYYQFRIMLSMWITIGYQKFPL
jgi:hypothetical protein